MFIGDIFGKTGRRAVIENISQIKKNYKINLIIANAENASHGRSLTQSNYDDLINAGIDIITMGNHTWDIKEAYKVLQNKKIIRPINVANNTKENKHGNGTIIIKCKNKKIRITNLVSMQCKTKNATIINPFQSLNNLLNDNSLEATDIHIVDFHAETTSEKKAFLYSFANKVSLIVGTHTHVQTADEQIYNNTAFITDVGMCGAKNSIIGAKPNEIIDKFKGAREHFHLEPAKGVYQFNSIIVSFDNKTNKPIKIFRYNINNN